MTYNILQGNNIVKLTQNSIIFYNITNSTIPAPVNFTPSYEEIEMQTSLNSCIGKFWIGSNHMTYLIFLLIAIVGCVRSFFRFFFRNGRIFHIESITGGWISWKERQFICIRSLYLGLTILYTFSVLNYNVSNWVLMGLKFA